MFWTFWTVLLSFPNTLNSIRIFGTFKVLFKQFKDQSVDPKKRKKRREKKHIARIYHEPKKSQVH